MEETSNTLEGVLAVVCHPVKFPGNSELLKTLQSDEFKTCYDPCGW
jgi:hypothetical protein